MPNLIKKSWTVPTLGFLYPSCMITKRFAQKLLGCFSSHPFLKTHKFCCSVDFGPGNQTGLTPISNVRHFFFVKLHVLFKNRLFYEFFNESVCCGATLSCQITINNFSSKWGPSTNIYLLSQIWKFWELEWACFYFQFRSYFKFKYKYHHIADDWLFGDEGISFLQHL